MITGGIKMEVHELEGDWPTSPKWGPRYSKENDHSRLRLDFAGSETVENNYSQAFQDMFVLCMLDGKRNGTYWELGADKPRVTNNTYILESEFGWTGNSFDIEKEKVDYFNTQRKNKCIYADATTYDYASLGYPDQIDYLSLDCDPADVTLSCLKQLPLDKHRFSVITYETDVYHDGADYRDEQRQILQSHGYQLIVRNVMNEGNPFEDWWVDPTVVPEERWKPFKFGSLGTEGREVILL
tara:strand:- start:99 stop:818 length:720 start_codon:yes stop_codon:yes gene_type:complete